MCETKRNTDDAVEDAKVLREGLLEILDMCNNAGRTEHFSQMPDPWKTIVDIKSKTEILLTAWHRK